MDYGVLVFPATIVAVFAFLWWVSKRQSAGVKACLDNTRAQDENTSAIRELIRKLDERKG